MIFDEDGFIIGNGINTFLVNPNSKNLFSIWKDQEPVFYVNNEGYISLNGAELTGSVICGNVTSDKWVALLDGVISGGYKDSAGGYIDFASGTISGSSITAGIGIRTKALVIRANEIGIANSENASSLNSTFTGSFLIIDNPYAANGKLQAFDISQLTYINGFLVSKDLMYKVNTV